MRKIEREMLQAVRAAKPWHNDKQLELPALADPRAYRVEVHSDDMGADFDPRIDCDNVTTMYLYHRTYKLGDEVPDEFDSGNYASFDELRAAVIKKYKPWAILPVYMYEHSGITISTGAFSCRWDSGQIGFVFISEQSVRDWWPHWKRRSKKRIVQLYDALNTDVNYYASYLRGEIYGIKLLSSTDGEEWEEDEAVWGIIGRDSLEEVILHDIGHGVITPEQAAEAVNNIIY